MKKLLCLSLAVLMSTSTMAANWEELGSTRLNNNRYYIDTSSIDNSGLYTKVWVKRIGKKLKTSKPKDAQEARVLYELDCASKQLRGISGVFYLFDGSFINEDVPYNKWFDVVPDSIFGALMQRVCN